MSPRVLLKAVKASSFLAARPAGSGCSRWRTLRIIWPTMFFPRYLDKYRNSLLIVAKSKESIALGSENEQMRSRRAFLSWVSTGFYAAIFGRIHAQDQQPPQPQSRDQLIANAAFLIMPNGENPLPGYFPATATTAGISPSIRKRFGMRVSKLPSEQAYRKTSTYTRSGIASPLISSKPAQIYEPSRSC
jgi:hypothetical protein